MVTCRRFCPEDRSGWFALRLLLWPDSDAADADGWLARNDTLTLVAETAPNRLIGFLEAGERAYADGCDSAPVAYLEGWFVLPEFRLRGTGAMLVHAAEAWARDKGYREFASDAELDNVASHRAHRALGYQEVKRLVLFRKSLQQDASPSGIQQTNDTEEGARSWT